MSYAEEAVKRGSLAVAACNGRDAIAMCLERPAADGDITDSDASPPRASETTVATSATTAAADGTAEDTARAGDEHVYSRRRNRRKRREGGVRDPGVGVGIVDSANNQDRKLCEVCENHAYACMGT